MQEAEVQRALKTYVGQGEPVMGLTADAVLAAGRRSRRTRRLAGFVGAGLAVALAGTAAVAVSGSGSTVSDFAAAEPCPVSPGSRPAGTIAADRPLAPVLVNWAATSLTCYLADEVPRLLPAATYAQVPGVPAGPLVGFSHGGEPPFGNRVDAMALIRDAQGTGDLSVTVGVVERSEAARAKANCRTETLSRCTVQTGPHGETVLLDTEAESTPAGEPRNFVVFVYRGRTEINVQASNTDRQSRNGGAPVATRQQPVLSANQTVQLALAPELYLFP
jgi:hypothetical protein